MKDLVLHGDRAQLLSAHPDKGERLYCFVVFEDRKAAVAQSARQPGIRGLQGHR